MMPRKDAKMSSKPASSSVKYHRMKRTSDDGFIDMQFNGPPPKIPYKAIFLAAVLFLGGSMLIILGSLLLAGIIDTKYADRSWPLLILGSLMFIPGAYHINIAYNAWKGNDGYSYQDIPEVD